MTALLDLSPTGATAKNGNLTPSGRSTATSITSFSTNSIKDIFQDNSTLLATLQEHEIHDPLGSCPACAGVCGTTKTQLQAKWKAAKDAKTKGIEKRKLAMAACMVEAVPKKKVRLISSNKAKVAKAGSRVNELCAKLVEATKGAAVCTLPGRSTAPAVLISPYFHSHKKCKGITGSPSSGNPLAVCSQLSLQQKMAMANKSFFVQSPLRSPLCSPETLSSSASSTSSSEDDDKMLVDKDTDDEIKTPFVLLAEHSNPLLQSTQPEVHRGCRYGSPLARGCVPSKFANRPVTSQARTLQHCKLDESLLSSNGSWMDNVSDAEGDANEDTSSNKGGDEGQTPHTPVCPTTLFNDNRNPDSLLMERDEVSILDRIWTGSHNIILLTRFVVCHFAGDWNSYLPFANWADSQSLE
jgi:hypothetical protein